MNGRRHDNFFDKFEHYGNLRIDIFFGEDFKDYIIRKILIQLFLVQ